MSDEKKRLSIPEPTMRRLPVYYQFIHECQQAGDKTISCTDISEHLGLTAIQVRKDLALTGAEGKAKTGYDITALLNTLEVFLGYRNTHDAFIVGAGHLGMALLGYEGFRRCGLNIVAAFDADPSKVGNEFHGNKILDMTHFSNLVRRMGIKIGILTVPEAEAQATADLMVKAGIVAIWNFAPVQIKAEPGVIVQNENLASSLVVLARKLSQSLNQNQ